MNNIERFIDHIEDEYPTQYSAGHVIIQRCGDFIIAEEQTGARETFSIGQPVYDKDGNLLGYLGIGLYANLDYAAGIRVPVEYCSIRYERVGVKPEGKRVAWKRKNQVLPDVRKRFVCEGKKVTSDEHTNERRKMTHELKILPEYY